MAIWVDVEAAALLLPRAKRGWAHEGSPTVDVGAHPFARRREQEGREILQFWCRDPADVAVYRSDPGTFLRVDTSSRKSSVWAWLDALPADVLLEVLAESWATRSGRRTDPRPDYDGVIVVVEHDEGLVLVHPGADSVTAPASLPADTARAGVAPEQEAERIVREQTGLEVRVSATVTRFIQVGTPAGTMRAHGLVATPVGGSLLERGDEGPVSVHVAADVPPMVPVRLAVRRVLAEYLAGRADRHHLDDR